MNKLFRALDDPTRRQIIEMLRDGDLTAGEIAEAFDMSKPSISHHLNLLKQAEVVISLKKGQYVYYSLDTTVFDEVLAWFINIIQTNTKSDKS